MPRQPRSLLPDGAYHVVARGAGKRAVFADDADRLVFLRLLHEVAGRWDWVVHALCLMTNHYHLVVGASRDSLSRGMHRLNGVYAQRFNRRHGRWGHLFGDRFSCRLVDEDEYLDTVCGYVLLNPVRAGLCARATDWPWSYCRYGDEID